MLFADWLRRVFATRPTSPARPNFRPSLENLEARDCPAGGALDPTFGTGGVAINDLLAGSFEKANDVTVQADGKIIAAGLYGGTGFSYFDFAVVRYNADGTLDSGFGSGGLARTDFKGNGDVAWAVSVQPGTNGKALAAGYANVPLKGNSQWSADFAVARYTTAGSLDTSFGTSGKMTTNLGGTDIAYDLAVLPDGKFVLAGLTDAKGYWSIALARYNANGSLDTTFGSKGTLVTSIAANSPNDGNGKHPLSMAVDGQGRLVVATTRANGSNPDFLVARFLVNGQLDTAFRTGGVVTTDLGSGKSDYASGLALQADGKVVLVGASPGPQGWSNIGLARYNADGSLDTSFGQGGRVLASPDHDPTGGSDPGRDTSASGSTVAVLADGKILVGGSSQSRSDSQAGKYNSFALMRFNADGSPDPTFGALGTGGVMTSMGYNAYASAMAFQADGKVVLAGQQNNSTPSANFALARYLSSGPQITAFTAPSSAAGANVTLSATALGLNPGLLGGVTQVAFYADSNNDGRLDAAGDTLLGYAIYDTAAGQWRLTITTAGWVPGTYHLLAQAKDGYGAFGDSLQAELVLL